MKIDYLILLARGIGEAILEYAGTHIITNKVEFGGDIERLVDRKAEDTLFSLLDILGENPDVLTEGKGYVKRGGEGLLVVDPVDGSVNADKGLPIFAVSIAYFENESFDSLSKAVIYEPIHKTVYYAEKGYGAFIKKEGEKRELYPPKKSSLESVYMSLSHNTLKYADRLLAMGIRIRELGSVAIGMAYTAAGYLDAFVDLRGILRIVDVAAGYLILKEAGYAVSLEMTESYPYPKFSVIAAHRSMIQALKKYLETEGYHNMFPRAP